MRILCLLFLKNYGVFLSCFCLQNFMHNMKYLDYNEVTEHWSTAVPSDSCKHSFTLNPTLWIKGKLWKSQATLKLCP